MDRRETIVSLLETARTMEVQQRQEVESLQLKLKYPQSLIYETEVALLEARRCLEMTMWLMKYAEGRLADLTSEVSSDVPSCADNLSEDHPRRRMNLSDEERERRRQRMKQMWTIRRAKKLTA